MNTFATGSSDSSVGQLAPTVKSRISSIDVLRGLVMLIMLVDHVRERIYLHMQVSDPMVVESTSVDLFFTRLSAHLCAPVFIFLTGLSAWLYSHPASGDVRSPSSFLFKRGLFIIVMEMTLINFSWMGEYHTLWLQVMWAIGLSMIALSVMVKLPMWMIATTGLVIVFGHNLLTPISFVPGETGYALWTILHDRGYLIAEGVVKVKISYPVLPWIGVIALGYFAGQLYGKSVESDYRTGFLLRLGLGCLALLLVLRGFNIYGETLPWEYGENAVQAVMSFFNFTKYPPSLDFLLMNLGVAFLLLSWFERVGNENKALQVLKTFGAAPMFFYVVHLYALLLAYWVLIAIFGANQGDLYGVNQFYWVWVMSAVIAVALYFPTKTFAAYKKRSGQAWMRYL
ncbi:MAG: heparan-alpha-glucosaminide N-acetyltransferase domain-containing protein [Porticoccaceae bacterium]|nr:heparan-alpha-glucosaminide N-acetyltransferase domain-containing protein [Porticoccaceae bacterium]